MIGSLRPLPPNADNTMPPALAKLMTAGPTYFLGSFKTPRGDLLAFYSVETAASEQDPALRQQHANWMKRCGTKPGHIQGYASDPKGVTLFRLESV